MKNKFILLLITILVFNSVKSQDYQYVPLPTATAAWNVFYGSTSNSHINKEYYTGGDTLVQDEIWTKIVSTNGNDEEIYQGSYLETGKIVRFCSPNGEIKTLYDFNLEIGDTVKFVRLKNIIPEWAEYWSDTSLIVEQINVILLQGSLRKRFIFKTITTPHFETLSEEWIEGIGSVHGILFPLNARTLSDESFEKEDLTCFWLDQNLLWQNDSYSYCQILKINEVIKNNNFKMYPNPTTRELKMKNEKLQIKNVEIFDMCGRLVHSSTYPLVHPFTVDVFHLPTGCYFVKVYTEAGYGIQKIIKK